ncbi:hypothetical protein LTR96_007734 [Exophiala xenobiotica]|nr:hypothetical protein LTR92_006137 [Exophiala xenobiotica]KAK5208177.1 hypothetical protein LTR41_006113 [Exophiala xenobiotica]KAK5222962.1 hypothetical protein LTR72_005799 [Exophiala xenobiotica]KAK5267067.1 hypothetical protein LTR96_007734 [Exophiala xenobiotica]KAK5297219.1 hypothetical protein LTR14_002950 [Exophiala xenobiotica]
MVFFILFNPSLDTPLSYHWGQDIYEACPLCTRAHECRTCDGETDITFQLCDHHCNVDEMAYDPAMLNEIRNTVHPLYSSVPSPELDRKQLLKKIKITTADLPRAPLRWRGQPSTINVPISTTGKYDNNNTNNGCDGNADGDILPHPVISHAHGKGCVYSDKPDVVLKSAEFVKTIDTFARMRLENLTRLLDAGITYVDDDLKVACTRRDETSTPPSATSTAASTTSASPASTSETDSELSDLDTNTTATSFTSASSRGDEKEDADVDVDVDSISLTRLFARLAANEVTAKMRSEQMRLQACLETSSLAKGLYWKRCNGVYRNALDDELLPATASASVSVSATASTTTTTDCDSTGKGKAIMAEDKEEVNVHVDHGHHHGGAQTLSGYGYAVLASPERARQQFRRTNSQASSVNARDLSPGSSSIGIGTPPPLSAPTSTPTSSQVSSISSTPSPPPPHGCETGSEELERKRGDYEEDHDDPEFSMIHLVRANPETFTFTSSILMNREAMVRSGAVDDDDLCLTGWGYNRLERRVKGSMN